MSLGQMAQTWDSGTAKTPSVPLDTAADILPSLMGSAIDSVGFIFIEIDGTEGGPDGVVFGAGEAFLGAAAVLGNVGPPPCMAAKRLGAAMGFPGAEECELSGKAGGVADFGAPIDVADAAGDPGRGAVRPGLGVMGAAFAGALLTTPELRAGGVELLATSAGFAALPRGSVGNCGAANGGFLNCVVVLPAVGFDAVFVDRAATGVAGVT